MIELNGRDLISQNVLKELESMCIQEEPPECQAACPMHLDVRAMISHIQKRDFKGANRLFSRAIPFSSIVAYTCDAPCKNRCSRNNLGGSIQMDKLEKMLSTKFGEPVKPPVVFPKKTEKAAIIGGGLRGMTAALALSRKGYKVTIFEKADRLGGRLLDNDKLPRDILNGEINNISNYPITVELNAEINVQTLYETQNLIEESGFEVAYISCKSSIKNNNNTVNINNIEGMITEHPRILANTVSSSQIDDSTDKNRDSSIYDVHSGTSAATTMDRIIQGVSLTAGREKEGRMETSLYTNLDGIEPVDIIRGDINVDESDEYSEDSAVQESERCIQCQCLECVKKCAFMQHYESYPKKLVREVYNNLSIALGTRYSNEMINSCALCGQCGAICPNGLDMSGVFRAAREHMVDTEKMPQSAFEFALLDMDYSLSDNFFMVKHCPGSNSSEYLFFPGCQLVASEPGLTKTIYEDLRSKLDGGVGLFLGCCGVMAKWAGQKLLYENTRRQLLSAWEQMGKPIVIAGCPTCGITLEEMGMDVKNIYTVLDNIYSDNCNAEKNIISPLYLHHACGARYDDDVKNSVISLAAKSGISLYDTETENDQSPCCGYGGLVPVSNYKVSEELSNSAVEQMNNKPTLTYCVNCRDRSLHAGSPSFHMLELIYCTQSVRRKWPTWSTRQDNRKLFKMTLLENLWGEAQSYADTAKLNINDELAEKLDRSHILERDIADVIKFAEETNTKFLNKKTGHFIASHKIGNVTFWVEYESSADGWLIHNAYSHRLSMEINNGGKTMENKSDTKSYDAGNIDINDIICVKCSGSPEIVPVTLSYMKYAFQANLPACSHCGMIYIPESLATGKMLQVEKSLEDK